MIQHVSDPLLAWYLVRESESSIWADMSEPSGSRDAFSRFRVSHPQTIFDSKLLADTQDFFWNDWQVSGAGTTSTFVSPNVTLRVLSDTVGRRRRQTRQRFAYQPGKSQLILITCSAPLFNLPKIAYRYWGLFDDADGLFFFSRSPRPPFPTGNEIGIGIRVGGVDTFITADQFNFGLSGIPATTPSPLLTTYGLDINNGGWNFGQVFFIDFEWLGYGQVKFGIFKDGLPVVLHRISNFGTLTTPYIANPNLPVTFEVRNTQAGGPSLNIDLIATCCTVISEGGADQTGIHLIADRAATPLVTLNNSNIYPLISVRLKSTHLMATVRPEIASIICTSTSAYRWMLLLNPTVVGVPLAFVGITNSAIEADVTAVNTSTVTGGVLIASGYAQNANDSVATGIFESRRWLGVDNAANSDILVLAVQRVTGGAETFYGSLGWHESV